MTSSEESKMLIATSRPSRYNNEETYAASLGLKQTFHGTIYQLEHLMLVVYRMWKNNYAFRLSTEMNAAEKFDDLVLEYEDSTGHELRRFVQFKHKVDGSKTKITASQLLNTTDGDFSVLKYFISWCKIKRHPNFGDSRSKEFILCTNIDLDTKGLKADIDLDTKGLKADIDLDTKGLKADIDIDTKGLKADIKVERVQESDEILRVTGRATQPPRYKLKVEKSSELWNTLKLKASDAYRLADELAKHIPADKKMELKTGIFKEYHIALAKEVINIDSKKFFDSFIENTNLSPNAKKFRELLLKNMKKLSGLDLSEEEIREDLKTRVLNLSKTFGEKVEKEELYSKTELPDDVRLADVLAKRIHASKKMDLNTGIFKEYHVALAKEVVDIKRKKFFDSFIENTNLSANAEKFRKILLINMRKLSRRELSEKEIREDLKKRVLNLSNTFGKKFDELYSKTELPDDADDIDDEKISLFLDEFILAVKQPNEVELGEMIKQEMGADSAFNLLNADVIRDSLQNKILHWFKEFKDSGKNNEFLRGKDAKAFFDEMETKLSSIITIGINLEYAAELEAFGIRYKHEIRDLQNFLATSNQIKEPIWLISSTQTLLTALRVYQILHRLAEENIKYKENDSYIFIRLGNLLSPTIKSRVLRAFKSEGSHNLLVVDFELFSEKHTECGNILELWNELLKIVNENPHKRMILIIQEDDDLTSKFKNSSKTHHEKDDVNSINNLEDSSRQELLKEKVVNFQGQENKTCFADLLGIHNGNNERAENLTNLGQIIDPNTLIQLIKREEVRIGSEVSGLGDVKDYYIERNAIFRRVVIEDEILRTPGIPDLFAISGIGIDTLRKLMEGKDEHKHVILENGKEDEQFEKLRKKYPDRNVHWLDSKAGKFIWKKTSGNIKDLINFEDEERAEQYRPADTTGQKVDQLFTDESQPRIIILSDVAGMGKSTVLTHSAGVMKNDKPNMLVIRIDLIQHTDKLLRLKQELKRNRSFDKKGIVDFLVDEFLDLKTDSEAEIFKTIIKGRGEAALFFDGFDEVSPKYEDTVMKLLQAISECKIKKLCVTTRPHTEKLLEKKLATFSHIMLPFSKENQTEFLTKFWKRGYRDYNQNIEVLLSGHAEAVINILKKSINIHMQEFTGVPLQTRMVAEVFPYGKKETLPETIDIIDLYEKFINYKYKIFFSDKARGDQTNPTVIENQEMTRKIYSKTDEKFALDALFDKATVAKLLTCQPEVRDYCAFFLKENEPKERTGLIIKFTNGKPEFIHRTFAEYLAAVFLIRTLEDDNQNHDVRQFCVSRLFLEPEYKTIRAFINCMLTKKSDEPKNISWGFDLHENRNAKLQTLYHVAARESNAGILKFFINCLNKRDEVNRSNIDDVAPPEAPSNAHSLDQQADIDIKDIQGNTALHIASFTTRHTFDVVKCLVDHGGADIQCRDKGGQTPLHLASEGGNLDIVKYFVEKGANIHCRNTYGCTPLHRASLGRNLDTVKYLAERGADIHCRDEEDWTPLHSASLDGHLGIVKYFTEKGADIHSRDEDGQTPLDAASRRGHLDIVKYFAEKAADIHCQDKDGQTPI